jgi:hypothetical protein
MFPAQKTAAQVASVPAPVGGWNARDSIANMEPTDAVELINFFPSYSNVVLRGGYSNHATGITGQVDTLMNYSTGTGEEMYAIAGTQIYDVTYAGPVGAPVKVGLTNARWEFINVTTGGGSYLYLVNGVDAPLLFDGTTWASITAVSPISITGVTSTTLDNITLFKNRVWFTQKNSLKAWYLPTNAVGGAAQALDLSSIAKFGGHITDVATWTIDAGYGVDDNLVFITSNGEVIVYSGTDPASSATWALIGVWKLGAPIGDRCFMKYGGDILILTYDGLIPLAASLQSSRLDPRVALSNKIQGAITTATTRYAAYFGWQIHYSAKNNAVWINVPVGEGNNQEQYVMNTITKSWCKFQGWEANCWESFGENPYFGGNGVVGKAWDTTYADNATDINTNVLQAFNYFEQRGVKKYFTRARPSIFTDGLPSILVSMNVDYDISDPTSALSYSPSSYGLWDTGIWGQGLMITSNFQGVTGIGYCGGVHLKSASQGLQLEWAATDVVYQTGWAGI